MKIQRLLNNIQTRIQRRNFVKKENEINKYLKIHDVLQTGDSYAQIQGARETIANYAKEHAVSVDIYEARKALDGTTDVDEHIQNNLSDKLNLIVTNMLTGKSKSRFVSAKTDITYPKTRQTYKLYPVYGEETEIAMPVLSNTEDNFIRHLYRNIEDLTKQVTKTRKNG